MLMVQLVSRGKAERCMQMYAGEKGISLWAENQAEPQVMDALGEERWLAQRILLGE